MAFDFNGTTQWLNSASPPVTAVPLTMAIWFNVDAVTADYTIFGLSDAASATHGFFLRTIGTVAGDPVEASYPAGSFTGVQARTTTSFTASTWHHACGVFTTNRADVYLDAGGTGAATGTATPAGIDDLSIGRLTRGTPVNYTDGRLAEAAVWSADLDTAEIAALAKGFSPLLIRPQSLAFYAPLVRGVNDRKGLILTNNNTAIVADHPRVIMPKRRQTYSVAAAAGGGTVTLLTLMPDLTGNIGNMRASFQ